MIIGSHSGWLGRFSRRAGTILCTVLLTLCSGCPNGGEEPPPDNGNDNETPDGTTAEIVSPSTGFGMSALDPPVSVRYNVDESATSISGFRVPVADGSPNSAAIGARVTIATNLKAGTDQFFSFNPEEAGVGFFRVGIEFSLNGVADDAESQAVIQVLGSPSPVFIQPPETLTQVPKGTGVFISFDCRDPEGIVQWRLFLLSSTDSQSVPENELGTQLSVGSGNVGTFTLATDDLDTGDFQIGVSATDSGDSVAGTADSGEIATVLTPKFKVVEADQAKLPTIAVTAPSAPVSLFRDLDRFTIIFNGQINEPESTGGEIEVFYDTNENVNDGFVAIGICSNKQCSGSPLNTACTGEGQGTCPSGQTCNFITCTQNATCAAPGGNCQTELPVSTTSLVFPKGVAEGTYFIGAAINDGINPSVTDYAAGTLTVVRIVTLDVTAPATSLSVAPGVKVDVKWATNAPAGSGTVDVFYQTVDGSGNPFGPELSILNDAVITMTTAQFSSAAPGLFEITVRLNLKDATEVYDAAPQHVRVTTLPTVLWLGLLAEADSGVAGAIFGGVNFEDNSGASLTTAGDLDGDTFDEFVIGSRYGKPFFTNPSGIGPGEAYIVYGGSGTHRLSGSYSLNSVGTNLLRGVVLRGVRTVNDSSDTDGLSYITQIPDADGDGKDELVFGFPRTNSAGQDALEIEGQFLYGGIVILSSDNSALEAPEPGNTVIGLDLVGRRFSNQTVTPGGAAACLADRQTFQAGPPEVCTNGTDTVLDTITGPSVGFVNGLAPACWEQNGFVLIPEGTDPAPGVCPTDSALAGCIAETRDGPANVFTGANGGSGFYAAAGTPLEPRGARVLGFDENDRFGTSVAVSRPFGNDSLINLIISAPNRTGTTDEIEGLPSDVQDSGVAYITLNRLLWGVDPVFNPGLVPPTPHQYIAGFTSHCGANRAPALGATRMSGDTNDRIQNMLGIEDFNGDGRDDIAVGGPSAGGGNGRLYIAYRREFGGPLDGLEGDFALSKLTLAPNDPERLDGFLIVSTSPDSLGTSLAGGFDFNGDGFPDLAVSSPTAAGEAGEVLIVFGRTGIVSPVNGITVDTLLSATRTASGAPVAARIRGNAVDANGQFGFNIANAGDIDGDGFDDLLVAAPNATPRFDPAPNDSTDAMTAPGLDLDFDGVQDEVPGSNDLLEAGLVYVILGSNRLDQIKTCQDSDTACSINADCPPGKTCASTDFTININQLGTPQLRGLIIAGRREGDRVGGGDAGDSGIPGKQGRGRVGGLAGGGDIDGDNRADILIGSILADPRRDPNTGVGLQNGGETFLIYGSNIP